MFWISTASEEMCASPLKTDGTVLPLEGENSENGQIKEMKKKKKRDRDTQ